MSFFYKINFGICLLLGVLLLCNSKTLQAQAPSYSKEETDRMILTYTFYLKQKISLEVIGLKYPNLKSDAINAEETWKREFYSSVKSIDSILNVIQGKDWEDNKSQIDNRYSQEDYSRVSEQASKNYIQTVNQRGYGQIQTPILETFLIWKKQYQKNPEKEFSDGYTKNFVPKEISKGFPLNMKVIFPKSWKETVVSRKPKVVQKIVSDYGAGAVTMTISIEQGKNEYSKESIQQLLSKKNLQKDLEISDIVLKYNPDILLDNCSGASMTVFHTNTSTKGKTFFINERNLAFYKNFKIEITFSIFSDNSQDEVMARAEKYRPLLKKIMNNTVILSQWGQ